MLNLYLFYLGGNAGKSTIEVHDFQFVVAEKPEDAYPLLRGLWYGTPQSLHIDGYQMVTWVDGYRINVVSEPVESSQHLYFVNVGGYIPNSLMEQHDFGLFVASTASEAKQKALKTLLLNSQQRHKDDLIQVDSCTVINTIQNYYIELVPQPDGVADQPLFQGYLPIAE